MHVLLLLTWVAFAVADVRLPPKITVHPESHIYGSGDQDWQMLCVAEGIPMVGYSWKKNGEDFELDRQNIKVDPNTGSFTFTFLSRLDEGYYQCFAYNQYGLAMSQVASLRQAILGTFPTLPEPRSYTANIGDYLMVECIAPNYYPVATFSWFIGDEVGDLHPTPVNESKRLTIDLKGNLHFGNVIQNDQMGTKIYMCTMYNLYLRTTKYGSESRIEVNPGSAINSVPEIKFMPEKTEVVVAGQTVEFQCLFAGYPTTEVSFMKVGEGPLTGRKKTTRHGTGMEISDVEEGDGGRYRCTGTNRNGQSSYEFNIEVVVIPVFDAESDMPHDINATDGATVTFTCDAKGKPEAEVQWFKNGVPIDSNDPGPKMRVDDNGKKLSIRDLCKTCPSGGSDLMVIQCNASNTHGYAFAEGYLNVLLQTTLTEIPEDINMTDWEVDVMFPCKALSDPSTPITLKWYFDDVEIHPNTEGYSIVPDGLKVDAVLLERQKKGKAEGKYTCSANNGWSQASHDAFLTLPQTAKLPQTECSYTFLLPKREDNSCPAWPVPSRPDDEEMEYLKSLVKLLTKNVQTLQEEVGALKEAQNGSCSNGDIRVGTNYVRWGRTVCPQTAQLVYQGFPAKSHYSHRGGGVNYLCLHSDPEWPNVTTGAFESGGRMYGVEYENIRGFENSLKQNDPPCAVCHVDGRGDHLMIPGRRTCPQNWTKEYEGVLVTAAYNYQKATYVCLDGNPEVIIGGSANKNGALFYTTQAACGALPCPPYTQGYEIACVVCTY